MFSGLFFGLSFSPAHADSIRLIARGSLALAAWTSAIDGAQKSIEIVTYQLNPCSSVGKLVLSQLIAKARSGVRVRILVDGYLMQSEQASALTASMARRGVEVRIYNNMMIPIFPVANMRSHSKFIVIDKTTLITGGRNLDDSYFGLDRKINFIDRDVIVDGVAAREAAHSFEEYWSSRSADSIMAPTANALTRFESSCLANTARDLKVKLANERNGPRLLAAAPAAVSCSDVKFTADHPDFSEVGVNGSNQLSGERYLRKATTKAIVEFMQEARHSLSIENWFYIPQYLVQSTLESNRKKGVKIEVFTNDGSDADHGAGVSKFFQLRDNLKNQRVYSISNVGSMRDDWELTPTTSPHWYIHAKTMVADNRDAVVSSFNLDPRSYDTNLESAFIVHNCPALATQLTDEMHRYFGMLKNDRNCSACRAAATPPLPRGVGDWWLLELL